MPKFGVKSFNLRLVTLGGVLLLVTGWLWWSQVYNSPQSVFWGMIDSSLATSSVTKHVTEKDTGVTIDRYTRLQTGSANAVLTVESTEQAGTTVAKDTIGTPDADYSRYAKIQTDQKTAEGKPVDFSNILGIWGKSPSAPAGHMPEVRYLGQGLLGTVPFANLSRQQRQPLIKFMKQKNVYQVSYGDVKKDKQNGRQAYTYNVQINPVAYFEMLQWFVKIMGLPDVAGLNPAAYANIAPLQAQFTVAKTSRELTKINYAGGGQDEFYVDYGLVGPIIIPSQTIPINELQNRIQKLR